MNEERAGLRHTYSVTVNQARKTFEVMTFYWSVCTSKESERLCICVLGVSMLPLSTIFIFDFRNVPKLWYSLCFILLKEKQYNGQRKMINNTAQKALEWATHAQLNID